MIDARMADSAFASLTASVIPHGVEAHRRQVYAALAALPSPDDAEPVIGRAFARPVGIVGRTMRPPAPIPGLVLRRLLAQAPQDEGIKLAMTQ